MDARKGANSLRKGRGPSTYAKIPPKGCANEIELLAKHRKELSPVVLAKRIQLMTPKQKAKFTRLSKITTRMVNYLRGGRSTELKEWAKEEWFDMCHEPYATCFDCTLENLLARARARFPKGTRGLSKSSLQRYTDETGVLKPKGEYIKPSNEPTYHWKLVSSRETHLT